MSGAGRGAGRGISALIVNFDSGPHLGRCLAALEGACGVVVVDNASTDGSEAAATDRALLLRNGSNRGFAAAVNRGLECTGSDDVLLLNPDCRIGPADLDALARELARDPEVAAAGPCIVDERGVEDANGRRRQPVPRRWLARLPGWRPVAGEDGGGRHRREVEALSGACMLIRREALEAIGGFDEDYFMHWEDLDWCLRARLGGWRLVQAPQATAVHVKGACSRRRPLRVLWHKHRGMLVFYRRHFLRGPRALATIPLALALGARFAALAPLHWWREGRRRDG